jgi:hypothetical protein
LRCYETKYAKAGSRSTNSVEDWGKNLEEYDSESRNASGEEETKKPNMPQWLTGIAALAGVLISVLSLVVTTIVTTKSTLEILAPRDMVDIPGKSCRVEWVATRKRFWLGEVPEVLRARVLVTKEGDPNYRPILPTRIPA